MAYTCCSCGQNALETKRGTFVFQVPPEIPGGVMRVPDAEWQECSNCGERVLPNKLFRALHAERSRRLGLLSAEEIKAIRENLGLTQAQMAELLGVGEKTYTRWESGKSIQNKSSDNLIRMAQQCPELLSSIDAQRQPDRKRHISNYLSMLNSQDGTNSKAMAALDGDIDAMGTDRLREILREQKSARNKTETRYE